MKDALNTGINRMEFADGIARDIENMLSSICLKKVQTMK